MPQSFTNLLVHLVFATKGRQPFITPELQPRLYDYLGGFVRGEKGVLYEIGGIADHVHLLARLHPGTDIIAYMRNMKSHSSGWVHQTFPSMHHFAWQGGYAAFSVSQSQVNKLTSYIQRQAEHHRTVDFRDEFIALLKAHEIEFDEKYLLE